MTFEKILFDVTDGVATITFNRDDKRNALNQAMAAEIQHRLQRAQDERARVVVMRAHAGVVRSPKRTDR